MFPAKPKHSATPTTDERDATIERLESSLADERKDCAALRQTIEGLRFKIEILEKGYAKQLADARQRYANAERALTEQRTKLESLGTGGDDTVRLLEKVRADLERSNTDRNQLRTELKRAYGQPASPRAPELAADTAGGMTINELIASPSWRSDPHPPAGDQAHLLAPAIAASESPSDELLSPQLIFTDDNDDAESKR